MASDYMEYKLRGADDIVERFRRLSTEVRRQVAVPAAKDAMEIVLNDAKDRADRVDDPSTPNYIPANIALVERKRLGQELGAAYVSVGVRRRRRGQGGGNTFYWWWVELGTERSAPHPFIRPALEQNRDAIFREFISSARYQLIKLGEY
ncbi:TPA: HK97-gp10 family putative phage morphogenesis protein [Pseudomonas aeruginosa]|nr:hypothetical protein [Pseudomonas aeruginosa]